MASEAQIQADLARFNAAVSSGDFATAGSLAAQYNLSGADVANYINTNYGAGTSANTAQAYIDAAKPASTPVANTGASYASVSTPVPTPAPPPPPPPPPAATNSYVDYGTPAPPPPPATPPPAQVGRYTEDQYEQARREVLGANPADIARKAAQLQMTPAELAHLFRVPEAEAVSYIQRELAPQGYNIRSGGLTYSPPPPVVIPSAPVAPPPQPAPVAPPPDINRDLNTFFANQGRDMTPQQLQELARSVGAEYDAPTGTVRYQGQTYNPTMDDKTAAYWHTQAGQDKMKSGMEAMKDKPLDQANPLAEGFDTGLWDQNQYGGVLDDMIAAGLPLAGNNDEFMRFVQRFGVDPTRLEGTNFGNYGIEGYAEDAPWNRHKWVQTLANPNLGFFTEEGFDESNLFDWGRESVMEGADTSEGRGDELAYLFNKNYDTNLAKGFVEDIPDYFTDPNLTGLTKGSGFYDDIGKLQTALEQQKVMDLLKAQMPEASFDQMREAAKYMYGFDLMKPNVRLPPSMGGTDTGGGNTSPGPIQPPSTDRPGGHGWVDNPTIPENPFGAVRHNIPVFNVAEKPWDITGGRNWRENVAAGTGMTDEQLYKWTFDKMRQEGWTPSKIQRALKLRPGDVSALLDKAREYAYKNGLEMPLAPSSGNFNHFDPATYGFGPQQHVTNIGPSKGVPLKSDDGQFEFYHNPIHSYLYPDLYKGVTEEEVQLARGGSVRDALNAIQRDPVIKKYMKRGGQADDIPAMLSEGEYVVDADVVAALGDGCNEEGARRLDIMRENIRKHKRGGSAKTIPPKAKNPEQYMKGEK